MTPPGLVPGCITKGRCPQVSSPVLPAGPWLSVPVSSSNFISCYLEVNLQPHYCSLPFVSPFHAPFLTLLGLTPAKNGPSLCSALTDCSRSSSPAPQAPCLLIPGEPFPAPTFGVLHSGRLDVQDNQGHFSTDSRAKMTGLTLGR